MIQLKGENLKIKGNRGINGKKAYFIRFLG